MIQHFVYNKNETLSYNDFGNKNGFPIFIQHGTMASIKDIGYFDELQQIARAICIARPGYGESSPYLLKNILEYGNIVSQLIGELSIKQFDVLSSSAGAPYGFAIAKASQNKSRSIYVYSGTPALYDENIQKNWPFPVNKNLAVDESQKIAYEVFFANIPSSELEKNHIKDSMANNCFGEGQNLRIRFNDWGFKLSEIESKVYMQHGKQDNIIPYKLAIMTKELLSDCKFDLLEKREHFSEEGYKQFIKDTVIKNIIQKDL
jgi:pimeloyl-ACP methyl ester carboxylesterase